MGSENRTGGERSERSTSFLRLTLRVLACGVLYYLTTELAWRVRFPNTLVSLIFPPHAVLVAILLLVPTRHWWIYTLAAMGGHFVAAQQAHWSLLDSLHPEAFNAVQNLLVAGGLRRFIKSPLKLLTLRDAVVFVLIAVVIVPVGTAFWGAAFNASHFGTNYWIEWRNLSVSNGVTAVVFVPAILLGASWLSEPRQKIAMGRLLEAGLLGAGILAVGDFVFDSLRAGPDTSPALLYAPIPLLIWAALRFGLGGTCASVLVITFQAIWGAMHGRGPFLLQAPVENALALQLFLLVTATPLMLLAVVIHEEKRSQNARWESEVRFRNVADTAPVLVWMSDTSKDCTFFNKGWLDFTGRTMEQELGYGWTEGVHPEDLDRCHRGHEKAFDAREPFAIEYRLRRHDGEYRWVLDNGIPRLDANNAFLGYIGSCIDITERKQAELEHQLQHMELARVGRVTLMGELAASLAHEINNPIGAMVTNAGAGQRLIQSGEFETDDLRELLGDIVADGHRAREVIQGIRNMVRRSDASRSLIPMDEIVHDLLRIVRADALVRKVNITAEIDPNLGQVLGDRVRLLQVLLNLTINAFEAMSVIRSDARRLLIRANRNEEGEISVIVRDSGPGFSKAIIDQVFEPFFSTKAEGTGMGLAIARSIIEEHGGTLSGENCDEGGACFTVRLPATPEDKAKEGSSP